MRWLVAVGLCCATGGALAQEPIRVVREQVAVVGCARLGEVRGSSLMGGVLASAGYDSALKEMREKSADLGGNHLLLMDLTSGQGGAYGFGEAYRCEAPQDTAASPAKRKR